MQQFIQERRRLLLLILIVLVLLCLVGAAALRLLNQPDDVAVGDTPTPTVEPTEEDPDVVITPEEASTPTPTRVIEEAPTDEPTEATDQPTDEDGDTPEATSQPEPPTPVSTGSDFTLEPSDPNRTVTTYETGNVLGNGGFEGEYDDFGVGDGWQFFKTDGAIVSFSGETLDSLINEGSSAQRISIQEAVESNRIAGIYQTVDVVPDEPYTLTIFGQVRSLFGDVEKSGYGYRVQYAVDLDGGQDWQAIPEDAWVELPWGEQLYGAANPEFSEYTTEVTPTGDQLTLFIRTWNKWPDPKLVEYTFDSLSFVGPDPSSVGTAVVSVSTEEEMIDGALPVTGNGNFADFMTDGRFWGAVVVLLLLAVGALYRAKWTW